MGEKSEVLIEISDYENCEVMPSEQNDLVFDFDSRIDLLESNMDRLDYLVSISGGLLCGLLDIFWVGQFNLKKGRLVASENTDKFVKETAKMIGWKGENISSAVRFLEEKFHIPSDGATPQFGGGLQHHLRDFAHHPTIVGLVFSLLTQFTYKSYGTNVDGAFIVVDVPETSLIFIGNNTHTKLLYGVLYWFFHLVSDIAGSSSSVMKDGGTGIPGPILSLAKELSVLPVFKNIKVEDESLSKFISRLFNGTLLARHDNNGKLIKESLLRFDFRAEMGIVIEVGKQAIPVVANEAIVRIFYFARRLATEIKDNDIKTLDDFKKIEWNKVKPYNNPTLARMLTIATGVFTSVDLGDALYKGEEKWLYINYVGVGRFAFAVGEDVSWCLKVRNLKKSKQIYNEIRETAEQRYKTLLMSNAGLSFERFSLTIEQTEILYNLEYHKTLGDINDSKLSKGKNKIRDLKLEWLNEWKEYISKGFPGFVNKKEARITWYSNEEIISKIKNNNPNGIWLRLSALEAMLFEPYYPLSMKVDEKGKPVASKKYLELKKLNRGFKKANSDAYLQSLLNDSLSSSDFIKRARISFDKSLSDLNHVFMKKVTNISVASVVTVASVVLASMYAPVIAVALVGSNFVGLSGAALTSASLAYLGGGAIAVGGAGMAGGTMTVIGGGAALGIGLGSGVTGVVGTNEVIGRQNLVLQSAKLLVAIKEIFLNDEMDIAFSNEVQNRYSQQIIELKRNIEELKHELKYSKTVNKMDISVSIKNLKESLKVMNNTVKSLRILINKHEDIS